MSEDDKGYVPPLWRAVHDDLTDALNLPTHVMWLDPVTHRPTTRWSDLRRTIACKLGRHRWHQRFDWCGKPSGTRSLACYDCGKRVE